MANSNFVVHNGLTVGPTTIDAASGNIAIPVGKQITIGNIILRDPGNGQLSVRDITDNSDVIINATLDSGSQTLGNIQIGTNHIESINSNGQLSFRPNGTGELWFSSNTIDVGRGGTTTLSTGGNGGYAAGHIRLSPGLGTKNVEVFGNVVATASNAYTLGNTTNRWSTVWGVAINAQYADLAENYLGDAAIEPGTVVHFGGDKEVSQCDTDMCTRVAGVVSTNPAYLMNGTQTGEYIIPVALTGRVPCKVQGNVVKGDMMVSTTNGRARAEANPKVGSVIGKALEDFNGLEGIIEVVVGKH